AVVIASPHIPSLLPYTTLVRSIGPTAFTDPETEIIPTQVTVNPDLRVLGQVIVADDITTSKDLLVHGSTTGSGDARFSRRVGIGDRKSTRLNSSHVKSSYAVFC